MPDMSVMTPMRMVLSDCARASRGASVSARPAPTKSRRVIFMWFLPYLPYHRRVRAVVDLIGGCASGLLAGQVTPGDVAEGHDRPERDASAGIVAAHDRGPIIADGIESGDRSTVATHHPTDRVRAQPVERAEIAHDDLERVVRSAPDRSHIRIGLVLGIAQIAVEGRRTASELPIDAANGALIVLAHRSFQAVGVDTYRPSEVTQGRTALQIAVAHEDPNRDRRRLGVAETIFPDRRVIADQPGRGLVAGSTIGDHCGADVVIGVRLIGKAAPLPVDRDHAGLVAVDEMGK